MDCSLPGSSVHGIFQARILEWVAHFLLQEIFLTQGLNPGLLHCRQMFYHLSHQGSPSGIEKSIGIEKAFFLVERYKIDTINLFTWYIYTLPCFRENLRQLTKMLKNKLAIYKLKCELNNQEKQELKYEVKVRMFILMNYMCVFTCAYICNLPLEYCDLGQ